MLSQNRPGAVPECTGDVQRLPTSQARMSFHSDNLNVLTCANVCLSSGDMPPTATAGPGSSL